MRVTAAGSRRRAPTRSAAVRPTRLTRSCFPPVPSTGHQLPVKCGDEAIGSAQLQLALERASLPQVVGSLRGSPAVPQSRQR